VYCMVT